MVPHCHRCGSPVAIDAAFCPSCGAPQLRVSLPDETPSAEAEGTSAAGAAQNPARSAAQPWNVFSGQRPGIDWRRGFRVAVLIAVPVGILTALPAVSLGFLLWVIGGPVAVVALYRRPTPSRSVDGRSGFRLGALTGLFAAYVSSALVGALSLIERYTLHLGGLMDREFADRLRQSTAMVQTGADTEAQMRNYVHFLLTPDGRAAMSLAGAAITALLTILLAGFGGMLGVRLFGRERAPAPGA
jgi:hypothetical protein